MPHAPKNLLIPFRRDAKRDFASGTGSALLRSKVRQVLLTQGDSQRTSGELPWRTAFGAGLEIVRHQASDAALKAFIRVKVRDALRRWVPEAELVDLDVAVRGPALELRIRVRASRFGSASKDHETIAVEVSV